MASTIAGRSAIVRRTLGRGYATAVSTAERSSEERTTQVDEHVHTHFVTVRVAVIPRAAWLPIVQ
jgi:hypothetical protein